MIDVLYDVTDLLGPRASVGQVAEVIETLHPDWVDRITTSDIRNYLARIA